MSVIYVPLFNFNVIVLVCDKKRRMLSSSNSYFSRISNMLSDIVLLLYCPKHYFLDHRLNVEQLYLLHKGVSTSEKLAAYE
jgi:hypothetical protein